MAENKFSEFYNKFDERKKRIAEMGSLRWLHNMAKELKYDQIEAEQPQRDIIGRLILYKYDAKHKETLPYWDMYPIGFLVKFKKDGFLLINFHYLPIPNRLVLMDALWNIKNNDKLDKTTKLNISYEILNNSIQYRAFKPCLKRYLNLHVKSKMTLVKAAHWDYAITLPLAKFQKQSETVVWRDSLKIINK